MESRKRFHEFYGSDCSHDGSPIPSSKKRKNVSVSTPTSSGKKFRQKNLTKRFQNEKVCKIIFANEKSIAPLNETSLPTNEKDAMSDTRHNESLGIGDPLKTSTPRTKQKTDTLDRHSDHIGRANDTDIANMLAKIDISSRQKDLYPEIFNPELLHIEDKHFYFHKHTPQHKGYSPKITPANEDSMSTQQKELIRSITHNTNTLALNCQKILKQIETLKANPLLNNYLSCVEIDHLTQLNRFTFWNSVLLHELFLYLPKTDNPSFTSYSYNLKNLNNFLKTRQDIIGSNLQTILLRVECTATNNLASIKFDTKQAQKAANTIQDKVRLTSNNVDVAAKIISEKRDEIGGNNIDSFSRAWLKLICSELGLLRKELRRNIYFGHREKELGELTHIQFLKGHRQSGVVVNSALHWIESMLHTRNMLLAEGCFVLNMVGVRLNNPLHTQQ